MPFEEVRFQIREGLLVERYWYERIRVISWVGFVGGVLT
jgi:hypothetical protein